ncbi:pyruvoyl-dependent arginine decarboxylase [bacterium]|nr:pyruvoyl-dependent arginine decarboxylase [bacterium]
MKIQITQGVGIGPTQLAAFDKALNEAGVANFNLIYLSSVVPPSSKIITTKKPSFEGEWGDKLYVVSAQQRTSKRHEEAWAGIGWVQDPKTGKGLFVEHEGHTKAEVVGNINASLSALAKHRKTKFGSINMKVVGTKCQDQPVCALVIAVFESEPWKN